MHAQQDEFAPGDVSTDVLSSASDKPFPGFAQLTSNATYCPNQFLVKPATSPGASSIVTSSVVNAEGSDLRAERGSSLEAD
jgi:hypothetical protein